MIKRRTWSCCLALQFLAVEACVADAIPRTEESEVVTMMSHKHELRTAGATYGELLGTTDFVSGSVQHQECQWPDSGRLERLRTLFPYARDMQVSGDLNEGHFYFQIGCAAPTNSDRDDYEDYKDEQEAVVYEGRRFAEDLGYEPEDTSHEKTD